MIINMWIKFNLDIRRKRTGNQHLDTFKLRHQAVKILINMWRQCNLDMRRKGKLMVINMWIQFNIETSRKRNGNQHVETFQHRNQTEKK